MHYAFRKLYANQADVEAFVSVPYTTASGTALGQLVSLLATGLIWLGGWLCSPPRASALHHRGQIAMVTVQVAPFCSCVVVGIYHISAARRRSWHRSSALSWSRHAHAARGALDEVSRVEGDRAERIEYLGGFQ